MEDPLIGSVLNDRVRIIRAIARGGMGKVYLGEQVGLGRPCAVKVLDPRLIAGADTHEFHKRFLLEASITSKLTHPNAVTIFDYGQNVDGTCFIAMEYLEGRTLSAELKAVRRLPPERAISIARQVCRALREAHLLGVVHRDMKPGNVFLVKRKNDEEDDFVKVLDFGLVKETKPTDDGIHTQIGQIMGSPRYMAPEQIQGGHVDARTDIYSLGVVLYTMLAGKTPFERNNEMATMMAHVSEPVPPLAQVIPDVTLPNGLDGFVMKCLAKKPEDRFSSMEEVLVAMKLQGPMAWLSSGSGPHAAMSVQASVSSLKPPQPASKLPAIVAALAVIAMGIGAVVLLQARGDRDVATGAPPAGPIAHTALAPPTVSAPPPPKPVPTRTLRIVTEPPGARVKEDDLEICASTPCEVVYKGDAAGEKVEHLLVITKPGYRVERKLAKATPEPFELKLSRQR
jgi:serine/threonine protein kinase